MRRKIYGGALIILFIDLFSKFLISNYVTSEVSIIKNFFYISFAKNTGGAFSIFSTSTYVLAIIGIAVLFYVDRYIIKDSLNKLSLCGLILLIGGTLGNIIDRLFNGYVIDFFRFIIFGYNFPIFNIADICICVGVGLLIIDAIRSDKNAVSSM